MSVFIWLYIPGAIYQVPGTWYNRRVIEQTSEWRMTRVFSLVNMVRIDSNSTTNR